MSKSMEYEEEQQWSVQAGALNDQWQKYTWPDEALKGKKGKGKSSKSKEKSKQRASPSPSPQP